MKKLHFALIGLGGMGSRWASVLDEVGLLDVIIEPREGTPSFEDVLEDNYINAVLIATPHGELYQMTRDALKAGKHVLCEKPGALTSAEVKKNVVLAEKNNLTYMVAFNHRYHDAFIDARALYNMGKIGEIIFIRARYGFGGRKDYDKEWRLDKSKGGSGELMDQGVHMIDLALSYMGELEEVKGFTSDTFWKNGNENIGEDNGFVLLKDKKGVIASIHVSLTQWKPMHNFEIYGTEGYLSIEGLGRRYGGDEEGNERLILSQRLGSFDRNIHERIMDSNPDADNSLRFLLDEFLLALKEGRQPVPSGLEAYETLKVVEEVYKQ